MSWHRQILPLILIFSTVYATAKECRVITLSNKSAELGVCPEHGRIVVFKLRQGRNVLWRNSGKLEVAILKGWKNYGGDKVWLIPQNMRPSAFGNRLPDSDIDGKPWRVIEQSKNSLTIQSRLSKVLGCFVARTITLDPVKPIAIIENRVIQKKQTPFPIHIWQVSQVVKPEYAVIGLNNRIFPEQKPYFRHRGQKSGSKITGTAKYIKIVLHQDCENASKTLDFAILFQIKLKVSNFIFLANFQAKLSIKIYNNSAILQHII